MKNEKSKIRKIQKEIEVENRTDTSFDISSLLTKRQTEKLKSWKVIIGLKEMNFDFIGKNDPYEKIVSVFVDSKLTYPLEKDFLGRKYKRITITFYNPRELFTFLLLHEFGHSTGMSDFQANEYAKKHFREKGGKK